MNIARFNRQIFYGLVATVVFILCILKIVFALLLSFIFLIAHEFYVFAKWGFFSDKNRFNARNDFLYDFSTELSTSITTAIKKNVLFWPDHIKDDNSCIILQVNLRQRIFGYIRDPYIKIECKGETLFQYFARGAGGRRYINLTRLQKTVKAYQSIKLTPYYCKLQNQQVKLIIFKPLKVSNEAIMTVSPHPDDAEIAAFGLYSAHPNSLVVTITAGEGRHGKYKQSILSNSDSDNVSKQTWLAGTLRAWDSITIPLLGGVAIDKVMNLGYYDGSLAGMYQRQDAYVQHTMPYHFRRSHQGHWLPEPKEHSWRQLVTDIELLLRNSNAKFVVCPHPLLDKHSDHQYTTFAVIEAIRNLNLTDGYLLLYVNHPVYSDCFPYGPIHSEIGLPPWFNDHVKIGGLYCHELDEQTQTLKLYALEAMHDLRPMFYQRRHGLRELRKRLYSCNKLNGRRWQFGNYQNFYRRSIRSQELFFVVPFSDVEQLELAYFDFSKEAITCPKNRDASPPVTAR